MHVRKIHALVGRATGCFIALKTAEPDRLRKITNRATENNQLGHTPLSCTLTLPVFICFFVLFCFGPLQIVLMFMLCYLFLCYVLFIVPCFIYFIVPCFIVPCFIYLVRVICLFCFCYLFFCCMLFLFLFVILFLCTKRTSNHQKWRWWRRRENEAGATLHGATPPRLSQDFEGKRGLRFEV